MIEFYNLSYCLQCQNNYIYRIAKTLLGLNDIQVNQNNAIFQLYFTRVMPDPINTKFIDPRLYYKYRSKVVQEQNAKKHR